MAYHFLLISGEGPQILTVFFTLCACRSRADRVLFGRRPDQNVNALPVNDLQIAVRQERGLFCWSFAQFRTGRSPPGLGCSIVAVQVL